MEAFAPYVSPPLAPSPPPPLTVAPMLSFGSLLLSKVSFQIKRKLIHEFENKKKAERYNRMNKESAKQITNYEKTDIYHRAIENCQSYF